MVFITSGIYLRNKCSLNFEKATFHIEIVEGYVFCKKMHWINSSKASCIIIKVQ